MRKLSSRSWRWSPSSQRPAAAMATTRAAVPGPADVRGRRGRRGPAKFMVAAYFPGAIPVRPGDTIVFQTKSVGVPAHRDAGREARQLQRRRRRSGLVPPTGRRRTVFAAVQLWNSGRCGPGPGQVKSVKLTLATTIAPGELQLPLTSARVHGGVIKVVRRTKSGDAGQAEGQRRHTVATRALASSPRSRRPRPSPASCSRAGAASWPRSRTTDRPRRREGRADRHVEERQPVRAAHGDIRPARRERHQLARAGRPTRRFTNRASSGAPFYPVPFSLKFTKAGTYRLRVRDPPGHEPARSPSPDPGVQEESGRGSSHSSAVMA